MKRLTTYILGLLVLAVIAEASSSLLMNLPYAQFSLTPIWRHLLMIALLTFGIYGRRHHGR